MTHRALLIQAAAPWGLTALLLIGALDRPVELTSLVPGESIERKVTAGEEQRFGISLAAGEYASIVLEQRGIDVEASILDAEGNPLTVFQDEVRPNGTERIELVAESAGTYVLVLRSVDGPRTSGACVIRMDSPRPATDADRQLQQARALHTRGRQMERTGKYPKRRVCSSRRWSSRSRCAAMRTLMSRS